MKKNALTVASMVLGIIGSTASPLLPTANAAPGAPVIEIQTYGSGYGELSARWWQWLLSIPASVNPLFDNTGQHCAQGQYDDVWFLAGSFFGSPPVTRACTIPAGKPVFFPLINTVVFKPFGYETLLDLRRAAADIVDTVSTLRATIDGVAIGNLTSFRVRSPSFTVIAPSDGVLPPGFTKVPGNSDALVSDGYWLLLSPLKPGKHVLTFHAETNAGDKVDVTFNLTVE